MTQKKSTHLLLPILFVLTLLCTSFHVKQGNLQADKITDDMLTAMTSIKTLRYKLKISERINGKLETRESQIKLQTSPRKLYMKIQNQELLWIQGANGGNTLVNPGTFPYVNLNLDPLGSIMRKGQRHTIHEMGFSYIASIIKTHRDKYADDLKKYFFITGEEVFDGKSCYKLSILMPDFKWEAYTVKKGENLVSIARKLFVSEYMILENNPTISNYNSVKEGQQIKVPNYYAKHTLLLVDKKTMLPISNRMIDDKGVFEAYQYIDLKINTPIAPEEFTKDYKDYKF